MLDLERIARRPPRLQLHSMSGLGCEGSSQDGFLESSPGVKGLPARKLWERSFAAYASAMPTGRSRALTLTPSMDSTMTNAASRAVHSLAVMIAPETLWSRPPCSAKTRHLSCVGGVGVCRHSRKIPLQRPLDAVSLSQHRKLGLWMEVCRCTRQLCRRQCDDLNLHAPCASHRSWLLHCCGVDS